MGCTFSVTPITRRRRTVTFMVDYGTQLIRQFDDTSVYVNKPVDWTDVTINAYSGKVVGFRDNGATTEYTMPDEVKEIRWTYVGDNSQPKNESYSFDEQQPEGKFYFVIDFNNGRFNNGVSSSDSFCRLSVNAVTDDVYCSSFSDRHEATQLLRERGFINWTAFSSVTNQNISDAFTLKSEWNSHTKTKHLKLIWNKNVVLRLYLSNYFPLHRGEDGSILDGKIPLFSNSNIYIKKHTGVMFKIAKYDAFTAAEIGKDKNGWYVIPPTFDEYGTNNYVIDLSMLEFDFITPFTSDYDIQDFLARSYEQTVTQQIKTNGSNAGFCSLCDVVTLLGGNDIIIKQDKDFISRDKVFIVKIIKQHIDQTIVYCIEPTISDDDNTSWTNYDMLPPKNANIRAELRGDDEMIRIKMADGTTTEHSIYIEGSLYKPLRSYYFYYDWTYHDLSPDVSCKTLADLAYNIGAVSISGDDGWEKDKSQNSWKKPFKYILSPLQMAFKQEYLIKTKQRKTPQHTGYGFVVNSQEINENLCYWTTIPISYIDTGGYAHVCLDDITLINSASRSFHIKDIPLSNYWHKNAIFIENACWVYEEDGSSMRSGYHTNTGYHFKDTRLATDSKIPLLGQSMQFKNYKANSKDLDVFGFNNNNTYAIYNEEKKEYNIDVSGYFLDESSGLTKQQSQMWSAVPQVFPIILQDYMSVPAEQFTIKCDINENTIRVNGRGYDIEENDLVCLYRRQAGKLSWDFTPDDVSSSAYWGFNSKAEGTPSDFRSYIGGIHITKDHTKTVNTTTDLFILKPGQYVFTESTDPEEEFPDSALRYYSPIDKTQDLLKHILITKTVEKTLITPEFDYKFTWDDYSFRVGPDNMGITCDFQYQVLEHSHDTEWTWYCNDGIQSADTYTPSIYLNGFDSSSGVRVYKGDSRCTFEAYTGGSAVSQRAELVMYNNFHIPAGLIGTEFPSLFSRALSKTYGKNLLNFVTYQTTNSFSSTMYVSNTTYWFKIYQLTMDVYFKNQLTNPYAYSVVLWKNMKEALDIDDDGLIYKTNIANCCEIVGLCANSNSTIKIPSHHNGKSVVGMRALLPDEVNELIIENQELINDKKLSDFFIEDKTVYRYKINKLVLRIPTIPKGFLDDKVEISTLIDDNSVWTIESNQTATIASISLGTEVNTIANNAFSGLDTKSQITIYNANKIGSNAFDDGIIFVRSRTQKPTTWDNNWIGTTCFVYWGVSDNSFVKVDNVTYYLNLDTHTATVMSFEPSDTDKLTIPQSVQSNGVEYRVTEIGGLFGKNHSSDIDEMHLPETIETINAYGLYGIEDFYMNNKQGRLLGNITTIKTYGISTQWRSVRIGTNVKNIDLKGIDVEYIYVEYESKPDGWAEGWCRSNSSIYWNYDVRA